MRTSDDITNAERDALVRFLAGLLAIVAVVGYALAVVALTR